VVVIDGNTLSVVEADPSLKLAFYSLIPTVDSVICCRATPAQKASIVEAIRSEVAEGVTLAIGGGANDIAMIQASVVQSPRSLPSLYLTYTACWYWYFWQRRASSIQRSRL
jgi:hypothetical protein